MEEADAAAAKRWEGGVEKTWEEIGEREDGTINYEDLQQQQRKRQRRCVGRRGSVADSPTFPLQHRRTHARTHARTLYCIWRSRARTWHPVHIPDTHDPSTIHQPAAPARPTNTVPTTPFSSLVDRAPSSLITQPPPCFGCMLAVPFPAGADINGRCAACLSPRGSLLQATRGPGLDPAAHGEPGRGRPSRPGRAGGRRGTLPTLRLLGTHRVRNHTIPHPGSKLP